MLSCGPLNMNAVAQSGLSSGESLESISASPNPPSPVPYLPPPDPLYLCIYKQWQGRQYMGSDTIAESFSYPWAQSLISHHVTNGPTLPYMESGGQELENHLCTV